MANMVNELTGNTEGIVHASRRDWMLRLNYFILLERRGKSWVTIQRIHSKMV